MGFDELSQTKISGGAVTYYGAGSTTSLYVELPFSGNISNLTVSNDSETDTYQLSFDGATLDCTLLPSENITFNMKNKRSVYIKGTAGGDDYRIWGF